ncbi:MAG TPA: hypothetical protein VGI40_04385 [Pirellulaceae bacterium]|jgi:hypothetical protein
MPRNGVLTILFVLFFFSSLGGSSVVNAFDPTSQYRRESIEGFSILINTNVLTNKADWAKARNELKKQLRAITQVVPPQPLASLKSVSIWIEWENKKDGAAEFHPSAQWLTEHGYNPEKAGGVEISNARNFVKWSQAEQPWMILHEMSHAYHHLALGENYSAIQAAYQNALDKGLYVNVSYVSGGSKKAYALTNAKEYFAELSEAYFGKNDYFPFTDRELRKYDPVGHDLMEQAWGKTKK